MDLTTSRPPSRRFTILCVEDDHYVAAILLSVLRQAGHSVEVVTNGRYALDRITAPDKSIDLLITDHQMPVMDGLELVTKAREYKFPGYVMVFSSMLSPTVADCYRALGVDRLVQKPASLSVLLDAVQTEGIR